jgi:hypothetical protein
MRGIIICCVVIASVIAATVPSIALAQTYEWVDDQGRHNVTDNLNRVPEKYRSGATRVDGVQASPEQARRALERQRRLDADNDRFVAEGQRERLLQQTRDQAVRSEQTFRDTATSCASSAKVDVDVKPSGAVSYFGTAAQRWNFEKCMTHSGQPIR